MNDITFFNNRLRDRLIERYHRTGRCGPQSVPSLNFSVLYDNVEVPSCFYHLAVALILQGEKTVTAGSRVYHYGEETAIVTASDLPTSYRLEASRSKPFVSTSLQLDARIIEELVRTEPRFSSATRRRRAPTSSRSSRRLKNSSPPSTDSFRSWTTRNAYGFSGRASSVKFTITCS